MTIIDPDEIWWAWVKGGEKGQWRLKRRYLKAFEVEGSGEYAIVAFGWGKDGWAGNTAFMVQPSDEKRRERYFNKQRVGRLIYKK